MKVSEDQLQPSAVYQLYKRYYDLYNNAPVGYLTINSECTISEANLTAGTMLNMDSKRFIGKKLARFLAPDNTTLNSFLNYIQQLFTTNEEQVCELQMVKQGGGILYCQLDGKPLSTENNSKVKLYQLILTDITERRESGQKLAETIDELTGSNAQLERFAYICSHDLQEPLRNIATFVQFFEEHMEGKLDDPAKQYMNFIVTGVERMRALINDILLYSSLGASNIKDSVDMNDILAYVKEAVATSILEKNAVITSDPLPIVYGDPTQLRQLLQNLISNALKFSSDKVPEITVTAKNKTNFWEFQVKDNGIGIEPNYCQQVFSVFTRLHGREYKGTGIGLAICKKVVELHGGQIWIQSEPGEGTTVFFTLACEEGAPQSKVS